MNNYMKALEAGITERIFYMVRHNHSYEWTKCTIETEEENTRWNIKTDYEGISITLSAKGAVCLTLSEYCHHNVDILIASDFSFDHGNNRTVDEIMSDVKTLTGVFMSGDMHHYMYICNLFAPSDDPVLDYRGNKSWRIMHHAYKETKD